MIETDAWDEGTRYRSSPVLMFRQFLCLAMIATMLVALAAVFLLGKGNSTLIAGIAVAAFLICVLWVWRKGYVAVTVTPGEVVVAYPGRTPIVVKREGHGFSSEVTVHSVNFIPMQTERVLKVFDDREHSAIPLPNLSKRSFGRLIAGLRSGAERAAASPPEPVTATFAVPKEAMLADFRRLGKILFAAGCALCLGLVAFLSYAVFGTPAAGNYPVALVAGGATMLLLAAFAVPVAMEYRKRRMRTPAIVSLDARQLTVGDDIFPFAELRRVVATPPDYSATDWSNMRKLVVEGDRGKKHYHFGVRQAAGVWKTAFADYGAMCRALERAAAAHGFDFLYDL